MRNYSTDVKQTALEKMFRPGGPKLTALSRDMNIPKETLYGWMRKAQNVGMHSGNGQKKRWSLRDKMAAVLEAKSLRDEELGRWLREKGLHEAQINAWEREINAALENVEGRGGREAEQRAKITELEREVNRKDKALAEMSALIVLKKKLAAMLGEEDL